MTLEEFRGLAVSADAVEQRSDVMNSRREGMAGRSRSDGYVPRFTGASQITPGRSNLRWMIPALGLLLSGVVAGIYLYTAPPKMQVRTWAQPAETTTRAEAVKPSSPSVAPTPASTAPAALPAESPASALPGAPVPPTGAMPSAPLASPQPEPGAGAGSAVTTTVAEGLLPQMNKGLELIAQGKLLEGRMLLSDLYVNDYAALDPRDAQAIRDTLTSVNQDLVFGSKLEAGDPLVEVYVVQSGEVLSKISPRYKIPYALVELINHTPANKIRAGQKLKMVKGPMHVVVRKPEFRMDVFLETPEGKQVYVRSFPVGLGEGDSTPPGKWAIHGKVSNPGWTNPRTNQYFGPDDPKNPIGEYWIGLQGLDEGTKEKRGFGIHGTIEPESVGKMMSMGCVRLRAEDIALLYKMLYDKASTVRVER